MWFIDSFAILRYSSKDILFNKLLFGRNFDLFSSAIVAGVVSLRWAEMSF